ncbi:unnamed protein product [Effrenium voratum]|uniref:Uncharacterized protein n=1 Tax=Effrenium voratum TaxID=2562239 RepID=A0AA36N5F4_9DINO|nr:unnamed protein product [Effrenium voratum]
MPTTYGHMFFEDKRGVGTVCDWLPQRGIGYLLCGSPPEKIIFHMNDVPKDYLRANGGKAAWMHTS